MFLVERRQSETREEQQDHSARTELQGEHAGVGMTIRVGVVVVAAIEKANGARRLVRAGLDDRGRRARD